MKYLIFLFSGFLLVGCSAVNMPADPAHAPLLPTSGVIKPFEVNPNVLEVSVQLQSSYAAAPVQVLRVGDEIKVTYPSDVLFGVGGEILSPSAQTILGPLVTVVKTYPQAAVRIDTFTDISGSPEKNVMHSEERAQSIARYLLNSGVAAESISLRGYGGAYPVASNEVAEGRTLNRRVVITISKIPVPAPQSAV